MINCRRETRIPLNRQTVTLIPLACQGTRLSGRLTDYSAAGLGLILDEPLAPGSRIEIQWGRALLYGKVVYSKQESEEFIAGIEVDNLEYDPEIFINLALTQ